MKDCCLTTHIYISIYVCMYNFIFPTEIALTIKHPDIVIWFIKAKKVFVIELTVPFEENLNWAHQC